MSKLVKVLSVVALLAGTGTITSVPAQAHWHGGGWHGGWRGGGWGWGPGLALGLGLGAAWGSPYYYGGPYYYGRPYYRSACGWSHIRVWRYNHWVTRRVWRCW
jgi:hypothetical protein